MYHDRLVEESDRGSYISTIRDICKSKLKVDFNSLCKNIASDGGKTVKDKDLGKLLFCDFSDTKSEDKFTQYDKMPNHSTVTRCGLSTDIKIHKLADFYLYFSMYYKFIFIAAEFEYYISTTKDKLCSIHYVYKIIY